MESLVDQIQAISPLEGAAVFFALLYVVLAARDVIYCWYAAAISSVLFIIVVNKAGLQAESLLHIFYFVMAVVGWYSWRSGFRKMFEKPIIRWRLKWHLIIVPITAALGTIAGVLLDVYTDAKMPYLDAQTTAFSMVATWMVTRKVLENWIYWIVIDIVSIPLYASRELYLSSILFLIYTGVAVYGYFEWKKEYSLRTRW